MVRLRSGRVMIAAETMETEQRVNYQLHHPIHDEIDIKVSYKWEYHQNSLASHEKYLNAFSMPRKPSIKSFSCWYELIC